MLASTWPTGTQRVTYEGDMETISMVTINRITSDHEDKAIYKEQKCICIAKM